MNNQQTLAVTIGLGVIALILHFWFVAWGIHCDPDIKLLPIGKIEEPRGLQITKCDGDFFKIKVATTENWVHAHTSQKNSINCGVRQAAVFSECKHYFGANITEGKNSLLWGIIVPIVLFVVALVLWFRPQNVPK